MAQGPLPEEEVARLGQQLAEGLEAAHAEGIVHLDLKPGNLRLRRDGRLKILDFGLARLFAPPSPTAATESVAEPEALAGTLPYMAPEQLRGQAVDARTDLWAAGAVLYEMATGRRPFESRFTTALSGDIQHKPVVPPRQLNPSLSPALEAIILKCLEKNPDVRFPSARALAEALRTREAPGVAATVPRRPRRMAEKALELDDSLAEAHLALGIVEFLYDWDWPAAEERFRRALELDPNSAEAYHQYSHLLTALGRHRESLRAALRALELDPNQPGISAHLGWAYLFARQYEQAIEQAHRGLRRAPEFPKHHHFLGMAQQQLKSSDEAFAALERAWELGGHPDELAALGFAYDVYGEGHKAREVLARLEALSRQRDVSPFNLALVHLGLGEIDRTLALLEQAYSERSEYMPYLKADPRLDRIRSEPRFVALVERMNFPE